MSFLERKLFSYRVVRQWSFLGCTGYEISKSLVLAVAYLPFIMLKITMKSSK